MNVYKLTYTLKTEQEIPAAAVVSEWFPSEQKAVRRRIELFSAGKLQGKRKDHVIEMHDVPVRKTGLLDWLNRECV